MSRVRNWCFTSFQDEPKFEESVMTYMIFQKEKGNKTNNEHYQGYIEFNQKMTMKGIKIIMNDNKIHLEPRRGTQKQAIDYCKKEDTRIGEPKEFGTPKKQGKRSDIDDILFDVNEGDTMKEILSNHGGNALRMIHAIEKAMKVRHNLFALDDYILLQRKEENTKDKLDEKIEDDLYKMLYK